ncbi:MAG: hypothetical protein WD646_06170 [Actinomycetota bacterium]
MTTDTYTIQRLREFNHPDLSPYVVHFARRIGQPTPDVPKEILTLNGEERLQRILLEGQIRSHPMFQTEDPVVCFTECTPTAVCKVIADGRYEPYGIAFEKDTIFQRGGGPALYVRGDAFHFVENLPPELRAMCTRFWPGVHRPADSWAGYDNFIDSMSEWIFEREWRILGDGDPPAFRFKTADIAFLVLPHSRARVQLYLDMKTAKPKRAKNVANTASVFIDRRGNITDLRGVWVKS